MEPSNVFPERALQLELLRDQTSLDPPGDIRKAAAGMRQHNFKVRKFVQCAGDNKFGRGRGTFKRKSKRVIQVSRLRQWVSQPLFPGLDIVLAIERMKQ